MNSVAITHYISNTNWHLRRYIVRYKHGQTGGSLNAKIKLLKFTRDKTGTIKDGAVITAMERHLKSLNTVLDDLDAIQVRKPEPEAVAEWGKELDGEIGKTDEAITTLKNAIAEVGSNQIVIDREKEHAQKEEEREEQLSFEKRKFELRLVYEAKLDKVQGQGHAHESRPQKPHVNSKLPELKVIKFDGKASSWLTFWNKFEAEIDKSDLTPTTKFAYLKEMLHPSIRTEIYGLPFTVEGYERAKTILKSEYGRPSEIVNAYIQNIMNLPIITGSQPTKVHELYKTLLFNIQSLETLGKLQDVMCDASSISLKGLNQIW